MAEWLASDYLLDAVEMRFHGKDAFGVCTLGGEEYLVVHPQRGGTRADGVVYQVLPPPSWWPKWWYETWGPRLRRVAEGPIKPGVDGAGYPMIWVYDYLRVGQSNWRLNILGIQERWRLGEMCVYKEEG